MDTPPHLLLVFILTIYGHVESRQIHVERMLGNLHMYQETYLLPRLPYAYHKYEPWLDEYTIQQHHEGVQKGHTQQMNKLLKEWRASGIASELSRQPLFEVFKKIDQVPSAWREGLRISIGGFLNHIFYFAVLTPNPEGVKRNMSFVMEGVFNRSFFNHTNFQSKFNQSTNNIFGNGYVYMARVPEKRYMAIFSGVQERNPMERGMQPLLGIDLWEHAYWNKYQNDREKYVRNWWKLVDYDKVENVLDWWWSQDPYDMKFDTSVDYEIRDELLEKERREKSRQRELKEARMKKNETPKETPSMLQSIVNFFK